MFSRAGIAPRAGRRSDRMNRIDRMKIWICCGKLEEHSLSKFPEQNATHLRSLSIPHPVHPVHPVDSSSLPSVAAQQFRGWSLFVVFSDLCISTFGIFRYSLFDTAGRAIASHPGSTWKFGGWREILDGPEGPSYGKQLTQKSKVGWALEPSFPISCATGMQSR